MPAKKSAKKSAKKPAQKPAKKTAKKPVSAKKPAKKAAAKKPAKSLKAAGAPKSAKKPGAKKPSAKKPVAKKPATSVKAAGAKKSATKSTKAGKAAKPVKAAKRAAGTKKIAARKPVSRPKAAPVVEPVPIIESVETLTVEAEFVDVGRYETEIFEPDPEVKEAFAEAAGILDPGRMPLSIFEDQLENLPGEAGKQSGGESPVLSGGDVDAAWDQADDSGEEGVGGSNPTPDQDVVEELGKAVGLTYQDNEPLDTPDKVAERDEHRWELEPQSSEDFDERNNPKHDQ